MGPRLVGRTVLITGAASGIGRATALWVAEEGAIVAALDIDAAGLEASTGAQAVCRVVDVTDRDALARAVTSVVEEVGLELAPRRIRVNVLAPGLTDTPMVHRIPGHVEGGLPSVPLGELVSPEEVAALAIHLLSDEART